MFFSNAGLKLTHTGNFFIKKYQSLCFLILLMVNNYEFNEKHVKSRSRSSRRHVSLIFCLAGFSSFSQEVFEGEVRILKELHATAPDTNLILFTGSSSIRLWPNLPQSFPQFNVLNTGFGGSQMSDLLYYGRQCLTRKATLDATCLLRTGFT